VSAAGVAALRADRTEVLALARILSAEEWAAASDCEGWRVQDVVAHLANTFRAVVDPGALAPGVTGDLEATQAAQAEAHRDWTPAEVVADYEDVSARALDALQSFQEAPLADTPIPLEDAGTYPLHLVANALAFDHFCHLRNDILAPNGPVVRPSPPADEIRVGATLEYLLAGLPQMSPDLGGVLDSPVGLRLTGPGGGEWRLSRGREGGVEVEEAPAPESSATSPATEFIVWGTGRRPWRERPVELAGDAAYVSSVLDAIRLF
jgi:uncharacterized protein (TIGR03083 family)